MRRLAVGLSVLALLLLGAPAWATTTPPYPAPSVSSASIQVLPSSSAALVPVAPTHSAADPLAYTGVSFNIGLTIAIAAVVVLLGVGLTVLGGRRAFGRRSR